MTIQIIKKKITQTELQKIAQETFGEMVKAVVNIDQEIIALGGELHADSEARLLAQGSKSEDLWGINIYWQKSSDERIEFTSLINIRPADNNRSMEIQDPAVKAKIKRIVDKLVE